MVVYGAPERGFCRVGGSACSVWPAVCCVVLPTEARSEARDALGAAGPGAGWRVPPAVPGIRVDVNLDQDPLAARLVGQLLEHRPELLARPAPLGPQVDDHGVVRERSTTSVLKVSSVTSMTGPPFDAEPPDWAACCLRCAAACRAPRSTPLKSEDPSAA